MIDHQWDEPNDIEKLLIRETRRRYGWLFRVERNSKSFWYQIRNPRGGRWMDITPAIPLEQRGAVNV
jgi:hypothetical protein